MTMFNVEEALALAKTGLFTQREIADRYGVDAKILRKEFRKALGHSSADGYLSIIKRKNVGDPEIVPSDTKYCLRCRIEKPIDGFAKDRKNKDGRQRWCRSCNKEYRLGKYTGDYMRNAQLKHHYGIDLEAYNRMCEKQQGLCAACDRKLKLVVDHNHSTGHIRELICHFCNVIVGLANEDPAVLEKIVRYILRHKSSEETVVPKYQDIASRGYELG